MKSRIERAELTEGDIDPTYLEMLKKIDGLIREVLGERVPGNAWVLVLCKPEKDEMSTISAVSNLNTAQTAQLLEEAGKIAQLSLLKEMKMQ